MTKHCTIVAFTFGCGGPAAVEGGSLIGPPSLLPYSASEYYSELVMDADGVVEDRGDGHMYIHAVLPATSGACEPSTALHFDEHPANPVETEGTVYFDPDLTVSTSVPDLERGFSSVGAIPWGLFDAGVLLSGGTATYTEPAPDTHVLNITDTAFCPAGYPPEIDMTKCVPVNVLQLTFTGALGEHAEQVGIPGWEASDGSELCIDDPSRPPNGGEDRG